MKALISPNETIYSYDGTALGFRVTQVSDNEFEVALPLFWVTCPDDCVSFSYYYSDGQFYPIPVPPPEQSSQDVGLNILTEP